MLFLFQSHIIYPVDQLSVHAYIWITKKPLLHLGTLINIHVIRTAQEI